MGATPRSAPGRRHSGLMEGLDMPELKKRRRPPGQGKELLQGQKWSVRLGEDTSPAGGGVMGLESK